MHFDELNIDSAKMASKEEIDKIVKGIGFKKQVINLIVFSFLFLICIVCFSDLKIAIDDPIASTTIAFYISLLVVCIVFIASIIFIVGALSKISKIRKINKGSLYCVSGNKGSSKIYYIKNDKNTVDKKNIVRIDYDI